MIDDKQEPAFPQNPTTMRWADQQGMSLRDYFAAKAMQAWLVGVDMPTIEVCAKTAYEVADAMLEARK